MSPMRYSWWDDLRLTRTIRSILSMQLRVNRFAFADGELSSDSFPMKLVDDLIWEFKGRHVVRKEGEITLAGANASAEGEDADDGTEEHVSRAYQSTVQCRCDCRSNGASTSC